MQRDVDIRLPGEAHDGARPRVELRRPALEQVALERGRRVGGLVVDERHRARNDTLGQAYAAGAAVASSFIPHSGHLPGASLRTSGCIGQA